MKKYKIETLDVNEMSNEVFTNDYKEALKIQAELKEYAKTNNLTLVVSLYEEWMGKYTLLESDTMNPTKIIKL